MILETKKKLCEKKRNLNYFFLNLLRSHIGGCALNWQKKHAVMCVYVCERECDKIWGIQNRKMYCDRWTGGAVSNNFFSFANCCVGSYLNEIVLIPKHTSDFFFHQSKIRIHCRWFDFFFRCVIDKRVNLRFHLFFSISLFFL